MGFNSAFKGLNVIIETEVSSVSRHKYFDRM